MALRAVLGEVKTLPSAEQHAVAGERHRADLRREIALDVQPQVFLVDAAVVGGDVRQRVGDGEDAGIGVDVEQLVRFDPDLKPVNWLAESWSVEGTAEKPIIDVHIRKGVKFHTGDPLTSADFEFSYQRLKDPKISRWTHLQAKVEKFEIIDDHHFKLHFSAPDGEYIVGSLQLWAMSKKYYEKAGEEGFAKAHEGWLKLVNCPMLEIRGDTTVEERIGRVLAFIDGITKG